MAILINGGEGGIRTPGRGFPLRRFSKPLLSTTQPPLREMKMILESILPHRRVVIANGNTLGKRWPASSLTLTIFYRQFHPQMFCRIQSARPALGIEVSAKELRRHTLVSLRARQHRQSRLHRCPRHDSFSAPQANVTFYVALTSGLPGCKGPEEYWHILPPIYSGTSKSRSDSRRKGCVN